MTATSSNPSESAVPAGTTEHASRLDIILGWIALDFDGRPWPAIALWLFGAQVTVFVISRVVDAIWFPETSYGFFAAMLLFAGYVFLDALQVGLGVARAALWATIVTIFWIFGAIPYALKRQHLQRRKFHSA